jgi:hypothetical protein
MEFDVNYIIDYGDYLLFCGSRVSSKDRLMLGTFEVAVRDNFLNIEVVHKRGNIDDYELIPFMFRQRLPYITGLLNSIIYRGKFSPEY